MQQQKMRLITVLGLIVYSAQWLYYLKKNTTNTFFCHENYAVTESFQYVIGWWSWNQKQTSSLFSCY